MSSGQQRGRGGSRGGAGGGRGDSSSRGRGGPQGGGGRGRGGGGPPGQGQSMQMSSRGPPQGNVGGIYGPPPPAPDPRITAAEDALVKVTRGQMIDGFPGRRGYGTKGKAIVLRTNYFPLKTADEGEKADLKVKTLYRYNVDVRQETSRPQKRRLLDMITKNAKFNNIDWATDYGNIIVTTEKLDLGHDGQWSETVTLPAPTTQAAPQDGQQGPPPDFVQQARARNQKTFRVTYDDAFSLRHIIDFLRSTSAGAAYAGRVDVVQLLNLAMCKPPQGHVMVANVGQNKFYPFDKHPGIESYELGGGLQALRGYYTSVRPAIGRLLVNINVTSGAFYKPIALIQLLRESNLRGNEQSESFIRMLKVEAVYKKDGESKPFMSKIKTIVGFAKQLSPATFRVQRFGNAKQVRFTFTDRSGPTPREQEISVFDYFRQTHGITLQQPNVPVLNVGTRADPQYLPVELCTVLPGQAHRRIVSGEQTAEMIKFAVRPPNVNAMSIAGTPTNPGPGVRIFRLAGSPNDPDPQLSSVKPFGFEVATQMISVPGRILASPRLTYGSKNVDPYRGSWNCANQKFSIPGRFGKWRVLVINRQGPRGNALIDNPQGDMLAPEPLFKELEKFLKDYGLNMGQRVSTDRILLDPLTVDNRNSNNRQIHEAYQRANAQGVTLLFIVLPEADKWLYARLKYFGDVDFGIHSICAVGNKMQKPNGQGMYLGNLALKFNIKGGGVNHKVSNALVRPLDNKTMLVGIDVTHPSPGSSEGAPSIACVVASTDENLFQWPGSIRTQTGRQEMVQGLEAMVLERLDVWRNKHGSLPTKIIIYRDGVSEGQYSLVLEHEMPPFYRAFEKRYGAAKNYPKVAVIVVGKRHHTRFYPTQEADADYNPQRQKGSWNPLPGTVVDRGIAGRVLREFWLQAHQGLQGTARPAHYVVIKDEIAFEADELEQFTHNMCYLFNRATKAVSICPPAYYADLLAERGRCYLYSTLQENHGSDSSVFDSDTEWTGQIHDRLKNSTWYI